MKWKLLVIVSTVIVGAFVITTSVPATTVDQSGVQNFKEQRDVGDNGKELDMDKMNIDTTSLPSFKDDMTNTKFSAMSKEEKDALFKTFKSKFSISYKSTDEESEKFSTFQSVLETIDERNEQETAAGGTAKHGVTRFSDMSNDEFKKKFLGFKRPTSTLELLKGAMNGDLESDTKLFGATESDTAAVTSVSWVGTLTTEVQDQGYCGSCWAFSAAQQLESDGIREGLLTLNDSLSPQQLISCDTTDMGCDGGVPMYAYKYIKEVGGLVSAEKCPYSSYFNTVAACETSIVSDYQITVSNSYYLSSEDKMMDYVLAQGPISACIDASTWGTYTGGILSTCGDEPNHCVQIVGINTDENYWLIRNSWGTAWGEEGYIRIKLGEDLCGVSLIPTYVKTKGISFQSSVKATKSSSDNNVVPISRKE